MSEPLRPRPRVDWSRGGAIPLADAEAAFFAEKRRIGSEGTRREYRRVFRAFRAFCAAHDVLPTVGALCVDVLTAYTDELETRPPLDPRHPFRGARMAPSTVSGYLRSLKTLCHFLVIKKALAVNPFHETVDPLIPSTEDVPFRAASAADLVRIQDAIAGASPLALRDRALVALDWDTGQRTIELSRLRLADYDRPRHGLWLLEPKNHRPWLLVLNPDAWEALDAYLDQARPRLAAGHARHGRADLGFVFLADPRPHGGRVPRPGGQLSESGLYQLLSRRWRDAGGASRLGWHRFRHGMASAMASGGATELQIRERLNHKSPKSTRRYTHLSPESVARAVATTAWQAVAAARAELARERLTLVPDAPGAAGQAA